MNRASDATVLLLQKMRSVELGLLSAGCPAAQATGNVAFAVIAAVAGLLIADGSITADEIDRVIEDVSECVVTQQ